MDNTSKIVNYLGKHMDEAFTMHRLSDVLAIPYASFYRTVQRIAGILSVKDVGKAKTLGLDTRNPVLRSYLAISSEEEKKEFLKRQPIIRKISDEISMEDSIVLLFGSYAKGRQAERSDIDILVINSKGSRDISFSRYELLFKKKINPVFVSRKEFQLMLRDAGENVGKQALRDNVVLADPEGFWGVVLDAVR